MQVDPLAPTPPDERGTFSSFFANPDPMSRAGAQAIRDKERRRDRSIEYEAPPIGGIMDNLNLTYEEAFGPRPGPLGPVPGADFTPETDFADIIAALGEQGGGGYTPVTVRRDLFRLAQTPEEQALLQQELADIEARRAAGSEALGASWAQVSSVNAAAAEKARQQVVEFGDAAAASWVDAAERARELAAERARAAGAAEGRQSINVSPTGGAEDFIAFMQSQAPAARQFAERTQQTQAADLDFLSRLGAAQGAAYQGDLQRQASGLAAQRAAEHNRAVQERIAAERMALANMEFQASQTNAQLAQQAAQQTGRSASDLQSAATTALLYGDEQGPAVMASLLGISPAQAQAIYESAKNGFLGQALSAQIAGFNR